MRFIYYFFFFGMVEKGPYPYQFDVHNDSNLNSKCERIFMKFICPNK